MNIQSVALLLLLLHTTHCNNVSLSLSTSTRTINSTSNYTLLIDRSIDALGLPITTLSSLSTTSVIAVYLPSFTLTQATCTNCTVDTSNSTITFNNMFSTNSTLTLLTLVINNVVNPVVSNVAVQVSLAILTGNSPVDVANTTVTFAPSVFRAVRAGLTPGNVTYNSNLTLVLTPSVGIDSMGRINVTIARFWRNDRKNGSTSTNIPVGVTCSSNCTLSTVLTNFVVTFSGVSASAGTELRLWINGVVSPPTTQPSDNISIVSFDSSFNQLDLSSTTLQSTLPNTFPLTNLSTFVLNTIFNLSFSFSTPNVFSSGDTIVILLPNETSLFSNSTVTLNSTVSSQTTMLSMPNTIQLSNTNVAFANPVNVTVVVSGLRGVTSTRGTGEMTVGVYRNGYLYNVGAVGLRAKEDVMILGLQTNTTLAAANSTYTMTLSLANEIPANGSVIITFPDAIILKNCSASIAGILCSLNNGKATFTTSLAYPPTSPLSLTLSGRNPVNSSGLSITSCSYDSSGYALDCGSVPLFQVQQASLPSSILTCAFSSSTVLALSNYTCLANFSNYQIITGTAVITFPSQIGFAGSSVVCTVGGSPYCTVVSTGPVKIRFNITEGVQVYEVVVGIMRNPQSTEPFVFGLEVADGEGSVYYNAVSAYLQMQFASAINSTQTNTNCSNMAAAEYTILFSVPSGFSLGLTYTCFQQGINISTGVFTNPLKLQITNQPSLKPWTLFFTLSTSDYLYQVFNSTLLITNCLPSYQSITSTISGLGQDPSVISLSLSPSTPITSVTITLPPEYNTSNMVCLAVTPLSCSLLTLFTIEVTPSSQTISLKLTNITNPFSSSYFNISTFSDGFLVGVNSGELRFVPVCEGECKSCLSGDRSRCTSCYSRELTGNYVYDASQNSCVAECSDGKYLSGSGSGSTCQACPTECTTCVNATACITCARGYILNHTCYTTCPEYYYPDDTTSSCKSCISPCSTCISSTTCKTCLSSYVMFDGICSQVCPNTTVQNNTTCQPCLGCQTCSVQATNCTSCTAGSFLYRSACVSFCDSGFVGMNGTCLPCIGCLTCTNTQTTCTSCVSSLSLFNFTCVSACPVGSYASSSSCVACSAACASCTSLTICQSCYSPYNLINSTCASDCPVAYTPSQGSCQPCISGCTVCTALTTCDACASTHYLYQTKCVTTCPSKTYSTNSSCQACQLQCLSCTSNTFCTSCVNGYYMWNGTCLVMCPSETAPNGTVCRNCSSMYEYCRTCTSLVCTTCLDGWKFSSGSCLVECPMGTVDAGGAVCQSCAIGCKTCTNSTSNCTACLNGYLQNTASCVITCPSPLISNPDKTTCVSCPSQCLTCTTTTSCLSCSSGYNLLNNQCLANCPDKYQPLNSICQACTDNCLKCDTAGCVQCSSGNILARGLCYGSCPNDIPFAYNGTCNKCAQFCGECSAIQCVNCSNGLLISGVNCVNSCPTNTELINGTYCKSIVDNTTNNTNNTNTTNNTITPTATQPRYVPVPFLITTVIWCVICIVSRMQFPNTYLAGCLSSVTGVISFCSWLLLVGVLIGNTEVPVIAQYLLIIAIALQVIGNIVFLVLMEVVYRDEKFKEWKDRKCKNKTCAFVISIFQLINFKIYLLQFSRLFDLQIFKACLQSIKRFLPYNATLIACLFLPNVLAIIGGSYSCYYSTTLSQTLLSGADCVIVSIFDIIFGVFSLKKPKQGFFEYKQRQREAMADNIFNQAEDKGNESKNQLLSDRGISQLSPLGSLEGVRGRTEEGMVGNNRVGNQVGLDQKEEGDVIEAQPIPEAGGANIFERKDSGEFEVDDGTLDATQSAAPGTVKRRSKPKPQANSSTPIEEQNELDHHSHSVSHQDIGLNLQEKPVIQPEKDQDKPTQQDALNSSLSSQVHLGIQRYIDLTIPGRPLDQTSSAHQGRSQHGALLSTENNVEPTVVCNQTDSEVGNKSKMLIEEQAEKGFKNQEIKEQNQQSHENKKQDKSDVNNSNLQNQQNQCQQNRLTLNKQQKQKSQQNSENNSVGKDIAQDKMPSQIQLKKGRPSSPKLPIISQAASMQVKNSQQIGYGEQNFQEQPVSQKPSSDKPFQQEIIEDNQQEQGFIEQPIDQQPHQLQVPGFVQQAIDQQDINQPLTFSQRVQNSLQNSAKSLKSKISKNASKIRESNKFSQSLQSSHSKKTIGSKKKTENAIMIEEGSPGGEVSPTKKQDKTSEKPKEQELLEGQTKNQLNQQVNQSAEPAPPAEPLSNQLIKSKLHTHHSAEDQIEVNNPVVAKGNVLVKQQHSPIPGRKDAHLANSLTPAKRTVNSVKKSIDEDEGNEQDQRYIAQKKYLKESPRLFPFKFQNRSKKLRSRQKQRQEQTLDVASPAARLASGGSDGDWNAPFGNEFEPTIIDLQKGQQQKMPIPKQRQTLTALGRVHSKSPPRHSTVTQKRPLSRASNMQSMLNRIEQSERTNLKKKQLEDIYLRPIRK